MSARPLLVCLDLQRAFVEDGLHLTPHAPHALLECGRLLAHARRNGWRVAHCYLRVADGDMSMDGDRHLPVPGFEPRIHETVIERPTLSAYGHAAFHTLVASSPHQCALVAGLNASLTFMATAFDAFERRHRFVLAADALASQCGPEASADQHDAVTRDIALRLGFPAAAAGMGAFEAFALEAKT